MFNRALITDRIITLSRPWTACDLPKHYPWTWKYYTIGPHARWIRIPVVRIECAHWTRFRQRFGDIASPTHERLMISARVRIAFVGPSCRNEQIAPSLRRARIVSSRWASFVRVRAQKFARKCIQRVYGIITRSDERSLLFVTQQRCIPCAQCHRARDQNPVECVRRPTILLQYNCNK